MAFSADRSISKTITGHPRAWKLERLAAHQARLRGGWRHPFAHDGPAQRPDPFQQKQANAAGAMKWQEIRKQAAVERVDRKGAAHDVGTAHLVIALSQLVGTGVFA